MLFSPSPYFRVFIQPPTTNDPSTWSSFDEVNSASGFKGVGFCFSEGDNLTGIDLDHCISVDGSYSAWAEELISLFTQTYIEKSPSGTGLHILCYGKPISTGTKKWKNSAGEEVGFEVYDYTSPRYLTFTGDCITDTELRDCQESLNKVHATYFAKAEKPEQPKPDTSYFEDTSPDVAEVASALLAIDADIYETWIDVGQALKAGGFPCELWDQWSARSPKYEAGECAKRWKTLNPSKITIKKIFYLAMQNGWQNKPKYNATAIAKEARKLNRETAKSEAGIITSQTAPAVSPANSEEPIQQAVPAKVIDIKTKDIFNQAAQQPGNVVEHPKWEGETVPYPFRLVPEGLLITSQEKPQGELFAGPLFVRATTESLAGSDGGLILEFQSLKGQFHTYSIPRQRLHQEASKLAEDLSSMNYKIFAGKEKKLLEYISRCQPTEERISCTQTGWTVAQDASLVFVFPTYATNPNYQFQPERYSPSTLTVRTAGTVPQWNDSIFTTDPYPFFAILASLSAAVVKFSGLATGGFHFYGGSSSGKTTLLQIAASIWGSGADPSDAANHPYINRWNTTLNALEGLAAGHNHLPLIMDELGSVDGRNYQRMIYDLSGGQGKSAMDASRNLRKPRTWQNIILSSGELSSQTKLEEAQIGKKQHAKAGALIRLIDVAVDQSMFKDRHHVDKIKRLAYKYFGSLGPAFISNICSQFSEPAIRDEIEKRIDESINRLSSGRNLNSLQERALKQFALCEATGILLCHFKLIPGLTRATVKKCIDKIVNDWLPSSEALSDSERGVASLREYILKYRESRFRQLKADGLRSSDEKLLNQLSGYVQQTPAELHFHLFPEAFSEACNGETKIVAKVLLAKNCLVTRKGRLYNRISVDDKQIAVYSVKADILELDYHPKENENDYEA
jgi:uncharacterized protein (DUF927 family)